MESPLSPAQNTPESPTKIKLALLPLKAWKALIAGALINVAPGIWDAWKVWAKVLIDEKEALAGVMQAGLNSGWPYLTRPEAATPYSLGTILFFFCLIPGGWIHDRWGPRVGAILGGAFLSLGFVLAGLLKSYGGLVLGFGLLGGMGMGLVSVALLPPAIRWFGPRLRGLAAGLVMAGAGVATLYFPPLASYLMQSAGLSSGFLWLGAFLGLVIILGGIQLSWPPPDYLPPGSPVAVKGAPLRDHGQAVEYTTGEMLRTRQYYLVVLLFSCVLLGVQLLLAHGEPKITSIAQSSHYSQATIWIWFTLGILAKTASPIATGLYSDKIGRIKAFSLNGLLVGLCLPLVPGLFEGKPLFLLMVCFFIAYWVFGGYMALMPAFVADLFGEKHLGLNYGLVILGCGLGSLILNSLATFIKDTSGIPGLSCYGFILIIIAIIMSYFLSLPSSHLGTS